MFIKKWIALALFMTVSCGSEEEIKKIQVDQHIPSLMLAIVTKDTILFVGGYGTANLDTKTPVNNFGDNTETANPRPRTATDTIDKKKNPSTTAKTGIRAL